MPAIPENVRMRVGPSIDSDARVLPCLRRDVQPKYVEVLCARAPHIGPPGAIVPPEHALRALRSCRSACSRVRLVLIADVARRGAGTGRKSNEQAGKQREHPDQTGKGDVRPPRSEPPFMRYAVQCSPPIAVRGRQRLSQDLPVAAGSRATLD